MPYMSQQEIDGLHSHANDAYRLLKEIRKDVKKKRDALKWVSLFFDEGRDKFPDDGEQFEAMMADVREAL